MIRQANESDIPRLAELLRQLHEHHIQLAPDSYKMPFESYFELEMRSIFEEGEMQIFTEEQSGTLTCYAALRIFERERAERTYAKILYIEHFVVGEEFRRQGCGTRLFDHLKGYAKENGCDRIQLGAAAHNAQALEFYKQQGFAPRTIQLELKL